MPSVQGNRIFLFYQDQRSIIGNFSEDGQKVSLVVGNQLQTGDVEVGSAREVRDLLHQARVGAAAEADRDDRIMDVGRELGLLQRVLPGINPIRPVGLTVGHQDDHLERAASGIGVQFLFGKTDAVTNIGVAVVMARLAMLDRVFHRVEVFGKRVFHQGFLGRGIVDDQGDPILGVDLLDIFHEYPGRALDGSHRLRVALPKIAGLVMAGFLFQPVVDQRHEAVHAPVAGPLDIGISFHIGNVIVPTAGIVGIRNTIKLERLLDGVVGVLESFAVTRPLTAFIFSGFDPNFYDVFVVVITGSAKSTTNTS